MKRLLVIAAMLFAMHARAQEVCNNGIDDDNDGFVDCYDKKCYSNAICKDFFIGKDTACNVIPTTFPAFGMKLKYSYKGGANHMNRLIVGDVDSDGKPEIISGFRPVKISVKKGSVFQTDIPGSAINIFSAPASGASGSPLVLESAIDIDKDGFKSSYEDIATADIDKDGCAEIFAMTSKVIGGGFQIIAYNCKGVKIWNAPIDFGSMAGYGYNVSSFPGVMGLVDFDGDGKVELYVHAQIFDAHTGKFMGEYNIDAMENTGVNAGVNLGWGMTSNGPIAVDIISANPGLELVAGCRIYGVSINRGAMTATLTPLKQRPEYATRTWKSVGSATSVADFNQDGYLDVLAVGSKDAYDATTTIFFWDVHNDLLKTYTDNSVIDIPKNRYVNGWFNGAGRVNVADIDGDTLMNAVYVSGTYLYALKEVSTGTGLDTLWRKRVTEETSGYTGCTMFDFNADGKSEIVYRDEENVYIYTTTNVAGVVKVVASIGQTCKSRTAYEYPIVADVDADGHAEVCVVCADGPPASGKTPDTGGNHELYDDAKICVFESSNQPWVAARRVWNQHGYFIVNVNDDLTIPTHQQLSEKVFADNAPCKLGGKSRPFNSFLNQAPFMNVLGCPQFAAPNLVPVAKSLVVNRPTCPDKDFTISLYIKNEGNLGINGNVPISFYNKNPYKPGAAKYNTVFVNLILSPNDSVSTGSLTVKGSGGPDSLYIVLNDAGNAVPTSPIKLPNTSFIECDYANTLPTYVTPKPVALTAIPLPNAKCGSISSDNGSASAFVPTPSGGQNIIDYNFYWTKNAVSKPVPADFTGPVFSGLVDGNYSVFAIHKTVNCGSDTVKTVVGLVGKVVTPQIQLIQAYSNCKIPDGELKVIANGGVDPVANFDYTWYEGNDVITGVKISFSNTATKLGPHTYTVIVTEKATGCQGSASFDMPDIPKPTITATPTNILCSNSNTSGVVTANVVSGGVLSDFDFAWFNGSTAKPTADFGTGAVYSGLTKGFYTVVATNKVSQCSSDTVTAQVLQSPKPVLTAPTVTGQTSCDVINPNGTATIGVVGGLPADYTFEWFESPVLTGVPAKTGASVTGLKSITYTIKVTEITSGCTDTGTATIPNSVVTPAIVTTTSAPNTSCTVNTGQIQVTSLSIDTPSDYDYQWYIGSSVKAVSDFPLNTTNTLSGLAAGTYTVVATHRIRKCTTSAKTITVIDNKPPITIAAPVNNPPNNCTSANGSISVSVTSSNTLGYSFLWFKGGVATGPPLVFDPLNGDINTSTSSKQDSLSTGTYTIQITDKDTGCKKEVSIFLPYKLGQKLEIVKTDITKCVGPGGSVNVKVKPTTGFTSAYYDVTMYQGITVDPGLGAPGGIPMAATGIILPDTIVYSMSGTFIPQDYTVVAVVKDPFPLAGNLQGCRAFGSFEVKRVTTDPDLNGNTVPTVIVSNKFCKSTVVGNPGNGSIKISVDDVSGGIPADEDFQWDPPAVAVNSATQSNLTPGDYTVTVTYKKALNFGCFSKRTFTVLDKPSQLTVNIAAGDLLLNDIVNCNASGYAPATNGSATFQRIKVDGVPVSPTFPGYSFAWQKSNMVSITDGNAQNWDLVNIPVGSYFVTATDNVVAKNCDVTASFSIQDKTVSPILTLLSFVNPTQCFKVNRLGKLVTQGSGPNSINYTYTWTSAPPLLVTQIGGASGQIAQNLNGGSYKIEVTNPANLCKANDTYVVPVERANISLSASSIPVTFCVPNPNFEDGAVHAAVISVQSVDQKITVENDLLLPTYYTYFWSNAPVPNFQGQSVKNLPIGSYTVKAVDKSDATCESESIKVDIQDLHVNPTVTAIPQAPVTNCDPTIPNGLATASVGGDNVHYTFTWYQQGAVASPPIFAIGYQADSLKANTVYLAQARDIVTGCTGTDTTMVKFVPSNGKPPSIDVFSDLTSCDINNPNGSLSASVNENVIDYIFTWTKVGDPSFTPRVMPIIDGLNVGTYKVSALEIVTKCPSEATGEIENHQVIPEFGLTLVDATCGKFDGTAGLYITNTESLNISTVEWKLLNGPRKGMTVNSSVLQDAEAGLYNVTVTTADGCVADKDFELKPQIHPYNGISRNSDGLNEYFHIDCIEGFQGNMVKIYNRAGTLVYEATNYNNSETLFDGKSNRGVSIMGTDLPDGTYFYIIDKRDGSKQLAGYLEIVN